MIDIDIDALYNFVKLVVHDTSLVYEDYLLQMIGQTGIKLLMNAGLLDTFGIVNGKQVYVLVNK